ncbi:PilZ domain-containing protein [Myxococcus sp. K15C18031901]|uniref:PilZ domain-containing protein n=1 Tax=Myxococcus dinghuensis TaxID=2906761 RepID=UPI0020A74AD5|nr:PilZ domain-containing protein [Myxococcus dinghuensis]MCP3103535.1 PilZ domain-containing protein [Myxococcus dinghuensis]
MFERPHERRSHLRFDKVFTVYLTTQDGMMRGVGRNISARGMFVEVRDAVGLGEKLKVTFAGEDGTEMTCLCEVRYQVALAFGRKDGREGSSRGVGLRIVAYEIQDDAPLLLVDRERVMH